jgi:hypothetical protein
MVLGGAAMHGDFPTIVGSIGVGLLLLAYFLNLIKRVSQDSRIYTTLIGDCIDQTVRSSAFRRSGSMIRTNRLKAELQTTNRLKAELQTISGD